MKRLWSQPGRWPRLVMLVACAVIVIMYWRNEDNAGQPDAVRGTGEYLPILDRGDGHMLYLIARSTALDLDWDFANDLKSFGDPWYQPKNAVTGRVEIPHPIGPPLVSAERVNRAEIVAARPGFVVLMFQADDEVLLVLLRTTDGATSTVWLGSDEFVFAAGINLVDPGPTR